MAIPPSARERKRRVQGLLRDATQLAMGRIEEDVLAPPAIAARSFVLVEEAAHVSTREYAPAEVAAVLARFEQRMTELAEVAS